MSLYASTFSGSLNSQYSPSIRFSSYSLGSFGNWMALCLKYMFNTFSCSSILQEHNGIVRVYFNKFDNSMLLELNRLKGVLDTTN